MHEAEAAAAAGPAPAPAGAAPGLASSATWRFLGTLARFAVAFVTVPVLTRSLGMSQWGVLALCQAAVAPLLLLDVGFGSASVKFVSQAVGRGDRTAAVAVVHTTLLFNAAMGTIGAAAIAAAAPWLATSAFAIPPEQTDRAIMAFRLVGIAWFVALAPGAWIGTLAAHQRYDLLLRLGSAASVLTAVAQIAAAFATGDVVCVIAAQIAAAFAAALLYRRAAGGLLAGAGAWPRFDREAFRRSARFGGWQAVATAGGMLSGWSDRYILGILFTPTVVGSYAVAQSLYTQLYGTFGEMGEVLMPAVSHREGRDDLSSARRLTLLAAWALTGAFGVCMAVVAAVGGDFLHLWISPQVARDVTATLRVMCAAGVVGMAAVAPFQYVLGVGEPRWNAVSAPLLGVTVLGVSLALVPRLGLSGVGYGLLAATSLRWGLVALIWRRYFAAEASLGRFAVQVWAPALISLLLLVALVHVHDALAWPPSWPWLVIESVVATALAAGGQLLAAEILPGGAARRRDLVASFRPVVSTALLRAGVGRL